MPTIDPTTPRSVDELDDRLSEPTEGVIRALGRLKGDILILGVGGKMGVTLARMAQRGTREAGVQRRVIGVSRFSSAAARSRLDGWGIETIARDLLQDGALEDLPSADNVVCMMGLKFGVTANPALSWAMNCYLPALVSRRYRTSRLVVFSSGNIYGLVPVARGGSVENDPPNPVGEYAVTILGRERIYEYFSRECGIPVVLLRLNYATELRYGVLVDLARKVMQQEPIDLGMGFVNVIWQRDANAMALQSLEQAATPPLVLNIAGPELLRVREVAIELARLLGRPVRFQGEEGTDALLSDASKSHELFGRPTVTAAQITRWTAAWVLRGGENLGKPTHFESRDGSF